MNLRMLGGMISGLLLAGLFIAPAARAGRSDQEIKFDFHQAVRIPGHVLPPGTYIFELVDGGNPTDLELIQIFDASGTKLIAIIQTVPAERLESSSKPIVTFDVRKRGKTPIMLRWFYPGFVFGHEFVYRKSVEKELARADEVTLAVGRRGATVVNNS